MSSRMGIESTIMTGTIDSAFIEVTHSESLDLCNPAQLRLFYLKLEGVSFTDEGLCKCLRRNIGHYVLSRTIIDKFKNDGDEWWHYVNKKYKLNLGIVHRKTYITKYPKEIEIRDDEIYRNKSLYKEKLELVCEGVYNDFEF